MQEQEMWPLVRLANADRSLAGCTSICAVALLRGRVLSLMPSVWASYRWPKWPLARISSLVLGSYRGAGDKPKLWHEMQLHYNVSRTSAGGLRTLTRPTGAKHIQYYNKHNQYMNSDYYDDKSRRIPTQPTDGDRSRQVPTGRDGYKQITADTTDADISRQLQTGSNRPQQFPTAPDRCRHIHRDPNGCRQIPTDTQSSRHIPTDPDRSRHPRHRYSTSSLTPSPPQR